MSQPNINPENLSQENHQSDRSGELNDLIAWDQDDSSSGSSDSEEELGVDFRESPGTHIENQQESLDERQPKEQFDESKYWGLFQSDFYKNPYHQETITLNNNKFRYLSMEAIVDLLLKDPRFTIYGGWCRDKILHEQGVKNYEEHSNYKESDYNNANYHPGSKDRLIVAQDLDVFFAGTRSELTSVLDRLIPSNEFNRDNFTNNKYFTHNFIDQVSTIFRTVHRWYLPMPSIKIKVDFTFHSDSYERKKHGLLEPPFNLCDFKCNAFLYDKGGYRLSRCTGTYLDQLDTIGRKKEEFKILKALIQHRTEVIKIIPKSTDETMDPSLIERRIKLISRIIKMQARGWNITNVTDYCLQLPLIKEEKDINHSSLSKEIIFCPICLEILDYQNIVPKLNCCGTELHLHCFQKHLFCEYESRTIPRCISTCSKRDEGWNLV